MAQGSWMCLASNFWSSGSHRRRYSPEGSFFLLSHGKYCGMYSGMYGRMDIWILFRMEYEWNIDRHCSFQGISLSYHCHLDNFGHLDSNISEHSTSSATAAAICQESSPHWASIQTPPSSMQQDPPQSWNRVRHGCSYPPHRSRDRKLRKPTRHRWGP